MENKRLKISRGVFGDEEDYHLVHGEEGGGDKERWRKLYFYLLVFTFFMVEIVDLV